MKILVDNALSYQLADLLNQAGLDAIHIRERIPVDSPDQKVFELAEKENRIILSADTDFGIILANRNQAKPSFILLRSDTPALPEAQASLVISIVEAARTDLLEGCIVSINRGHARVRKLPLR